MEIRLKESELKEAVELWIENEGFSLESKRVVIDFTAGRAPNGFSAEVETFKLAEAEDVAVEATQPEVVEDSPGKSEESPFLDDEPESSSDKVTGTQPALDLDLD